MQLHSDALTIHMILKLSHGRSHTQYALHHRQCNANLFRVINPVVLVQHHYEALQSVGHCA